MNSSPAVVVVKSTDRALLGHKEALKEAVFFIKCTMFIGLMIAIVGAIFIVKNEITYKREVAQAELNCTKKQEMLNKLEGQRLNLIERLKKDSLEDDTTIQKSIDRMGEELGSLYYKRSYEIPEKPSKAFFIFLIVVGLLIFVFSISSIEEKKIQYAAKEKKINSRIEINTTTGEVHYYPCSETEKEHYEVYSAIDYITVEKTANDTENGTGSITIKFIKKDINGEEAGDDWSLEFCDNPDQAIKDLRHFMFSPEKIKVISV